MAGPFKQCLSRNFMIRTMSVPEFLCGILLPEMPKVGSQGFQIMPVPEFPVSRNLCRTMSVPVCRTMSVPEFFQTMPVPEFAFKQCLSWNFWRRPYMSRYFLVNLTRGRKSALFCGFPFCFQEFAPVLKFTRRYDAGYLCRFVYSTTPPIVH